MLFVFSCNSNKDVGSALCAGLIQKRMVSHAMNVAERLAAGSMLTRVQLETLELQKRVLAGEIKLSQAAAQRVGRSTRGPVTVGAYYRVLNQARGNIRASILTVLAAMQLGYVKFDDLARLLQLVGQGSTELGGEEADRLIGVINALLDRLVT